MKRLSVMIVSLALATSAVRGEDAAKPAAPATPTGIGETAKPAEPAAAAATNAPADAPKIKFDQTVYDFGSTSMVQQLTGTFTFHNTGSATLEVKKPTTSCGCTVAGVKPDKLAPGEKGELVFTMNVGSMTRGRAEKHITVPSNDPQTPSINLTVKAEMIPTFEVTPQQVNIGDVRQGMVTNVSLYVKRVDGKKLVVSKVEPSAKFIRTTVVPDETSEQTAAKVTAQVEAEGTPRRFNERIVIYADDPAKAVMTVNVSGRLVGDVTLVPEAVFWGIADPQQWTDAQAESLGKRSVKVTANTDKAIEIKNPTSSLKDIQVSVVPVETGKVYEVIAKLSQPPKESERGTISFETNLASQPSVSVPVTINVLKR